MTKCPVCQKPKSEYEMRPLFDVKELAVGDALTEQKSERDVGGAKLQMVCRSCWAHILEHKEKNEVIEMMETLAGLLLELDRRQKEKANPMFVLDTEIIEKGQLHPVPMIPAVSPYPQSPPWVNPITTDGVKPWGNPTPIWRVGMQGMELSWGSIIQLGNDFEDWNACVNR